MDQDQVEVHKLAIKEWGQYQAILIEQAWSITELLHGFRGNFSCRTLRVIQSWQDSSIVPAREPIAAQNFIHLACSQSWPKNKASSKNCMPMAN